MQVDDLFSFLFLLDALLSVLFSLSHLSIFNSTSAAAATKSAGHEVV